MVERRHWIDLLERAWRERNVLWLAGVRRAGKTFLCQSLQDTEYLDCEIPGTRARVSDPVGFLGSLRGRRVVLDEIHRLQDPSELLKIAADHYPDVKVVATGSSTLGASTKFKDALTGRKRTVLLTPMTAADLRDFGSDDLDRRFLRGGLPPFFLSEALPEADYQDWVDAYWAKDIQELFRLERRSSFQRFMELLFAQSGGIFEATRFAGPCEVSRQTVSNYLAVLEATLVAVVVRPYSSRKSAEIVSAPKVYGFDTGFVCAHRGWVSLRRDDKGVLWEHLVLNESLATLQGVGRVLYWRDKAGHEVDFVLERRGKPPLAIECKWSHTEFDATGLLSFRRRYPGGENFVVAHDVDRPYERTFGDVVVRYSNLEQLRHEIEADATRARPAAAD